MGLEFAQMVAPLAPTFVPPPETVMDVDAALRRMGLARSGVTMHAIGQREKATPLDVERLPEEHVVRWEPTAEASETA